MKPNEIYHGDCLDLMGDIPDKSIDMILADLPYGTTACRWDSIIPLEPLWEHYKRVIKDRGAIVLTGSQPFTSKLVMSNLDWFKWDDVWDKKGTTGFLDANKRPLRKHETILMFSNGQPVYNPQMRKGVFRKKGGAIHNGGVYSKFNAVSSRNDTYFPVSIIEFSNANQTGKLHPTQKPVALFAYLIRTYTNPGDLVLDNVAGSGTTAIAAIETGRDWLLIEKDPEYYEIAKKRIQEKLQQPMLLEPV